jgi:hypothetical protein
MRLSIKQAQELIRRRRHELAAANVRKQAAARLAR